MPQKLSAGMLMYRQPAEAEAPEVFLVHPGGPFFAKKDKGWWGIPKGLPDEGEELIDAAKREFAEETGLEATPPFIPLGEIVQSGGKKVHAWTFEGNIPESWVLQCNTFRLEWPPKSGKFQDFPEADQGRFFKLREAEEYILPAQKPFLERLGQAISERSGL